MKKKINFLYELIIISIVLWATLIYPLRHFLQNHKAAFLYFSTIKNLMGREHL